MKLPHTPMANPAPLSVAPPIVIPPEPAAKPVGGGVVWDKVKTMFGKGGFIGKREVVIIVFACLFLAIAPTAAQFGDTGNEDRMVSNSYRDESMGTVELPEGNFPGSAFYYLDNDSAEYAAYGIEASDLTAMGVNALPAGYPAGVDGQAAAIDGAEMATESASLTPPMVLPGVGAVARPFRLDAAGVDYSRALRCLTDAIYYEAASESEAGQRAVAQVIINRMRHPSYPDTICGVIYQGSERVTGCQFSYSCDGSMRRTPSAMFYSRARGVAASALAGSVYAPVGLATHYHTTEINPYWAPSLRYITTIGAHRFYTFKGSAGTNSAFFRKHTGNEPFPGPKPRAYTPTPAKAMDPAQLQAQYERDYADARARAEADAKAAEAKRGIGVAPAQGAMGVGSAPVGYNAAKPAPTATYQPPVYSPEAKARGGDQAYSGGNLPQSGSVKSEFENSGTWKQ
jgi:Cell Wall Hydrolase